MEVRDMAIEYVILDGLTSFDNLAVPLVRIERLDPNDWADLAVLQSNGLPPIPHWRVCWRTGPKEDVKHEYYTDELEAYRRFKEISIGVLDVIEKRIGGKT